MLQYTLKRLYSAVLVIFAVSIITFLILTTISGNAAMLALGTDATPQQLAALEHALGLDLPWYLQYLNWLKNLFCLDLGTSMLYGEKVMTLVLQRLPVTISVAVFSMVISLTLAFFLGTLAAVRKNGIVDVLCRSLMQIGNAVPAFWISIIFIIYIALRSPIIPVSNFVYPSTSLSGYFFSILLPSCVLAIGEIGPLLRSVRTSMLDSLQQDYMMMAKVHGFSAFKTYLKYGLRGALSAPLSTAGLQFAKLLGGTTVVESVFSLPGLGRLVLVAVEQRDLPLLQGSVMFITTVVVLVSLATDLLTAALNPQLRLDGKGDRS